MRAQGSFSLRRFHRSWGIMRIRANISAPRAVLDFPARDDFARQLKTRHCDAVGISGLIVNVRKQERKLGSSPSWERRFRVSRRRMARA
jgi:hypothetical protein